jgi:hypothetical protein
MPVSSLGYVLGLLIGSVFIVIEARINARLSKLETRVSSIKLRDSTRLPTPLDAQPSSAGELMLLPMPDNGGNAGNGGQVQASSPLDVKLSHEKGFVSVTQKLDPF